MTKNYFGDFRELKTVFIPEPAMDRQIFYGDNVMLVRNVIKANTTIPMHSHPEEQISYVISGSCEITVEGEKTIHGEPGAVAVFPSNVAHEVIVGNTDTEILDIFSPIREDFLPAFEKGEE